MKAIRLIFCLSFFVFIGNLKAQNDNVQHDWENQQVIQIGAEETKATFYAYPSAEKAISYDRNQSTWFVLLNLQ